VRSHGDPWPAELRPAFRDVAVGIARTVPDYDGEPGVAEIQYLYLDMIAAARRTIYLENQYFTARELGEALAARLREQDGPEVIVVLRFSSTGWLEAPVMQALRSNLLRTLREADLHGRFRACYPRLPGLADEECCDLHSKLMIVDEEWLRVGSANFANRSMGVDTECDLVVEARGDPHARGSISQALQRLLAEHLGTSADVVGDAIGRHGSVNTAIGSLAGFSPRTLVDFGHLEDPPAALVALAALVDPVKPVLALPGGTPVATSIACPAIPTP
jgi:phosphatidylserine/phosphatidylglycerophosphate/cardiolipin synthase-like enzyme